MVGDVSLQGEKKSTTKGKGCWGGAGKEDRLDGEEEERRWGAEMQRCFNKRAHVEKHSFSLTFSLSPSLSLHRTEEGGGEVGRNGERNDIFICSFKGSLLSPFKRNPLFLHLSLRLFLYSLAPQQ